MRKAGWGASCSAPQCFSKNSQPKGRSSDVPLSILATQRSHLWVPISPAHHHSPRQEESPRYSCSRTVTPMGKHTTYMGTQMLYYCRAVCKGRPPWQWGNSEIGGCRHGQTCISSNLIVQAAAWPAQCMCGKPPQNTYSLIGNPR